MHALKAIALKIMSALLFAVMSALVRFLGEKHPVGQIVFFRSAFAILPVVIITPGETSLPQPCAPRDPPDMLRAGS